MKKMKIIALSLILVFFSASCSKERRIEKSLSKKAGGWNIIRQTDSGYTNGTLDYSNFYENTGTLSFSKSGQLFWKSTIDGDTEYYVGTWSNTADNVTLNYDDKVRVFALTKNSKNNYTLENKGVQFNSWNGNPQDYIHTLELERN